MTRQVPRGGTGQRGTVQGGAVPLIERIYTGLDLDVSGWLASIRDACLETFDDSAEGAAAMAVTLGREDTLDVHAMAPDERLQALVDATLRTKGTESSVEPLDALQATGRVQHAEGEARELSARDALRAAARSIDRARSARSAPGERLDLWAALVYGRWSLVETFDSDGRRFFVARRNEPTTRPSAMLDLREREVVAMTALGHPLKVVAYDLGLSEPAASAALQRAMSKLRVRSRAALIQLHGAVIGQDDPPPS